MKSRSDRRAASIGPFDCREYDADEWGADLIGFAPPYVAWEVARPDPHASYWIVTDNTGSLLTAGDFGEGFCSAGAARAVASHFMDLRREAVERERWRRLEDNHLEALLLKPAGYHRAPQTSAYRRGWGR